MWLYLRGVFHNPSNINKVKFTEGNLEIHFVGDNNPTLYFKLTEKEKKSYKPIIK